jgi:ubiquinone/menaquinone biosynthesis C-methylase UbiE
MSMSHDATTTHNHDSSVEAVRAYFDAFAEGEWERLESTLAGQVSFEVHRHFLEQFIRPGMRVLEIGAGPGRFTIELARLGCRIVVTDISPVQLELNERFTGEAGAHESVERRELVDVCDLGRYRDGEFDAVVAYGGPLSYAFDRAPAAMAGMLRVTSAGGPVIGSVMSTLGAFRQFLPGIVDVVQMRGDDVNDQVLATGDLRPVSVPGGHSCRMFRWREFESLVVQAGGRLLGSSASNWASLSDPTALAALAADPGHWSRFLANEIRACAEPGVLEGGTHMLFAAQARQPGPRQR